MQNVKHVRLNLLMMEGHASADKTSNYGYKLLRPFFFVDDMINFSKLCQLFNRDLQRIVIFDMRKVIPFDKFELDYTVPTKVMEFLVSDRFWEQVVNFVPTIPLNNDTF